MVLHLPHEQGGFGVTNNTVSRHAALYASTARFVAFLGTFSRDAQQVWLPGNNLDDPSTWVAPPLRMLQHLHEVLVQDYECTDQPAAAQLSQPPGPAGGAAAGAGAGQPPQSAGSQDQQDGKLILPQLNRLHDDRAVYCSCQKQTSYTFRGYVLRRDVTKFQGYTLLAV